MANMKRFSALGYENIVENRDCVVNPYAEVRSSYLRKRDLEGPTCDFSEMPTKDTIMKMDFTSIL